MSEGDIALTPLPQADGNVKPRPTVLLRRMPPFGDWLVCGISTQVHQAVADFDDLIEPAHTDFRGSGLKAASLIRLGFLTVLPADRFLGSISSLSPARHAKLRQRLAAYLAVQEST